MTLEEMKKWTLSDDAKKNLETSIREMELTDAEMFSDLGKAGMELLNGVGDIGCQNTMHTLHVILSALFLPKY